MTKLICDFCEQEIHGIASVFTFKVDGYIFEAPAKGEYTMCRKCAREMRNHMVAAVQLMERFGTNKKIADEADKRRKGEK